MKRWDLLLVVGVVLLVVGVGAFDWRFGSITAGLALAAAWYWLAETEEG